MGGLLPDRYADKASAVVVLRLLKAQGQAR